MSTVEAVKPPHSGVKRAWCFWCDSQLFWSTLHGRWYSADRSTHCRVNGKVFVHLASETKVER